MGKKDVILTNALNAAIKEFTGLGRTANYAPKIVSAYLLNDHEGVFELKTYIPVQEWDVVLFTSVAFSKRSFRYDAYTEISFNNLIDMSEGINSETGGDFEVFSMAIDEMELAGVSVYDGDGGGLAIGYSNNTVSIDIKEYSEDPYKAFDQFYFGQILRRLPSSTKASKQAEEIISAIEGNIAESVSNINTDDEVDL